MMKQKRNGRLKGQGLDCGVHARAGTDGGGPGLLVVRGTRRGVPGVAWHMRRAVAEVAGDGVWLSSSSSSSGGGGGGGSGGGSGGGGEAAGADDDDDDEEEKMAAAEAAAHEAAGGGINAGQVSGCVVVSAPPIHAHEALTLGLGELLRLPYAEWGLTTNV